MVRKDTFFSIKSTPPAHRAESAINDLDLLGFDRGVDHAPYRLDLAPMDFKIFQTSWEKIENSED